MLNEIADGWFSEISPMWEHVALSIGIEEHLLSKQSEYQRIDVFKTKSCGNMLVLDGIIQATELDEFAYQEMLTHIPMCAHPNPRKILVIGGGDGGILREIARHDCVEEIDICEIDLEVIEASKKYLPSMACGFDDPRVNLHLADGSLFIKDRQEYYDVIIVDSSDPIGPGEALFTLEFYEGMRTALQPDGIIATQGESFFLHGETVKQLVGICRKLFKYAAYAYMLVPTYPGGNIGTCVGSHLRDPRTPARKLPDEVQNVLRYYNPEIHESAFILPEIGKRLLEGEDNG
jgi:spermidine synthase